MFQVLKQIQLRGRVTASMVLLTMPQAAVQKSLPSSLSLASQPFTPPGTHPVFFAFTKEDNVHFVFNEHKFLTFKEYWEFVLEIPFVQKQGDKQSYIYPVRLYLNRLAPTLAGLLGYGFPKRLARFEVTQSSSRIATFLSKTPLLLGDFDVTGERGPISKFRHFQPGVFDMLNQPYLTHYPPIQNFPGLWLCSSFDYHFEQLPDKSSQLKSPGRKFEQAQIQAMPAEVQLCEHFAQRFFPGLAGRYPAPGINESPLGSFRLWADWSLTPC